ncbi:hypothetical protein [Shewanella sp. OMA3-2]|uniref:hypothetical protein n=1 Tax=Shewanella sp. OMA3-2 TaxID=2908650 RepID=UPI001F34D489|nr:hypothetical protein [Shewanella sp. OMA3-2]UJF22476.1 hypothetical protein L0B17_03430 [Shewanella sp. OMA3-2]
MWQLFTRICCFLATGSLILSATALSLNSAAATAFSYQQVLSAAEYQLKTPAKKLDYIDWLSPQYPTQAKTLIDELESLHQAKPFLDRNYLRLHLLSCLNLIDLGLNAQAVKTAKRGVEMAQKMRIDLARPYFLACEASALDLEGEQILATLVNEESIKLAQLYNQPQALIQGLMTRSIRDNANESLSQASENMKVAIELYPAAKDQTPSWHILPEPYLKLVMSNLMYSAGDSLSALEYAKEAQASAQANGMIAIGTAFYLARISISSGEFKSAEKYLALTRAMTPESGNLNSQANFNAQTAYIELHLGNLLPAEAAIEKSIEYFINTNDDIKLMRAKRTLAMIYFAQHKTQQALVLMNENIAQANHNNQYELAFYQQELKYAASQKANEKLTNTRIAQLRANREPIENITQQMNTSSLIFQAQNIALLSLAIFILLASFIFFLSRKPKTELNLRNSDDPLQQVDTMLDLAKQSHSPLTLLLLDTVNIRDVDVAIVRQAIQQVLREQDRILLLSDRIAVLLPFTTDNGAARVVDQLAIIIQPYQAAKVNFGIASLQQLDNLDTLIKRAELNKLGNLQKLHKTLDRHNVR